MAGKILSLSVHDTTVMFTTFPNSLRAIGHLFYLKDRTDVRSSCYPDIPDSTTIYVCGNDKNKDSRELKFKTLKQTEDFLNSLAEFCLNRNISFSCDGKIVLGGL